MRILTKKITRNIIRKKTGNKGLKDTWERYQNQWENGEIVRGKNYGHRSFKYFGEKRREKRGNRRKAV